jgi:elongation factor 1-beta
MPTIATADDHFTALKYACFAKFNFCPSANPLEERIMQEFKPVVVKAKAAPAKAAPEKKAAPAKKDDDSDSDDDMDFDDMLGDDEDDEETAALLAAKADQIKAIQARQAAKAHKAKSNLTLDIKPLGSDTDMEELERLVREIKLDGVTWLGGSLIDVAFGVKKLRILVQLVDVLASPDQIREQVEDLEDYVQSTDVFAFQMA